MADGYENHEPEIGDPQKELEHFQQEKDRVRGIIGKAGGIPTVNSKAFNIIFIVVILASVITSFFGDDETRLVMIELAAVAISIKILYMMHCQSRVNHFQVWMQSSIEWRINEVMKLLREVHKKT